VTHSTPWKDVKRQMHTLDALDAQAAIAAGDEHVYLSTSCLHGKHSYCADLGGASGPKVPAECKFCKAPCICECHGEESA